MMLDPCRAQTRHFDAALLADPSAPRPAARQRGIWAVSLVDRGTGEPHRVGGLPLVVMSRDRDLAIDHLMDGRDPEIWAARAVRVPRPASDA